MKQKQIIIYDGTCKFCQKQINHIKKKDKNKVFEYISSTNVSFYKKFNITKEEVLSGIIFLDKNKHKFEKAAAIQQIYFRLNSTHFFAWGRNVPLLKQCIDFGYFIIAKYRYKLYGGCKGECRVE